MMEWQMIKIHFNQAVVNFTHIHFTMLQFIRSDDRNMNYYFMDPQPLLSLTYQDQKISTSHKHTDMRILIRICRCLTFNFSDTVSFHSCLNTHGMLASKKVK
jgi:hypothetical protein